LNQEGNTNHLDGKWNIEIKTEIGGTYFCNGGKDWKNAMVINHPQIWVMFSLLESQS
jgi:hypothetical protein